MQPTRLDDADVIACWNVLSAWPIPEKVDFSVFSAIYCHLRWMEATCHKFPLEEKIGHRFYHDNLHAKMKPEEDRSPQASGPGPTQEGVTKALNQARENGHDQANLSITEVVDQLIRYTAGFENATPEELFPLVSNWQQAQPNRKGWCVVSDETHKVMCSLKKILDKWEPGTS